MNAKRNNNSLNTIRLLAALQVMWGHLIQHLQVADIPVWGGVSLQDIIGFVLNFFPGVPIFFFISGFLIPRSAKKSNDGRDYFIKRFVRLYPELWMGVLLELITIMFLYFNQICWGMLVVFAGAQATVFQFWTPDFLRGYGCGTPNGSLWTIVVFIQFYVLIWIFRKLLDRHSTFFWTALEIVFVLIGTVTPLIEKLFPEIIVKLYNQTIFPYLWIFGFGMLVSEYWDSISIVVKKYWYIYIIMYILYRYIGIDIIVGQYPVISTIITSLGCMGIAFAFPRINIKIDISYEMYILHMVIVNVLITQGIMGTFGMILALIFTIVLSVVLHQVNLKWIRRLRRIII